MQPATTLKRGACALVALAATFAVACSGGDAVRVSGDVDLLPPMPTLPAAVELKKVVPVEPPTPPWAPKSPEWSYVLGVDHGIRTDDGGKGAFLAPRAHGKHNGIDFLAPVGTPLLSACNGKAKSDKRGGYGTVVQIVCKLPDALGGGDGLYASLFYAHLHKTNVPTTWTSVKAGAKIGTVGKTGNASGPKIKPHLHLEVIIRESEEAAREERHSGLDADAKDAADRFFELIEDECLKPAKFQTQAPDIRRERRADPFILLMCAAKPKPDLTTPDANELRAAQAKWSAHYSAKGFDVDRGPR